jgi:hypothetical protein
VAVAAWAVWAAWITKIVAAVYDRRRQSQARLEGISAAFFFKNVCKAYLTNDKDALHCFRYE